MRKEGEGIWISDIIDLSEAMGEILYVIRSNYLPYRKLVLGNLGI